MIACLAHNGGVLANCIVLGPGEHAPEDDCGLCHAEGRIDPPHNYDQHTHVRIPGEEFHIITDRYMRWERWDGENLAGCLRMVEATGLTVLAVRRIRGARSAEQPDIQRP